MIPSGDTRVLAEASSDRPMNRPLRVLMVGHAERDAQAVLAEVRRAGFAPRASEVSSHASLVEALHQQAWDIVLSEGDSPNLSGLDSLATVRALQPELPFVIVAEAIPEETVVAAMKEGADDYVPKRRLSRLGPLVERALRDAQARRARQAAVRQLHEQDIFFRSVIENVADLILVLDHDRRIRYCSPSVVRTLGRDQQQLIGNDILDYLHPDERQAAMEQLAAVRHNPQDVPLVAYRTRHNDGQWQILEGTVSQMVTDPAVSGIVCNFRNVTHQRQLQQQLVRAQRLESIGSLAGGIAHDLNNMLTPVMVAAELLQDDLTDADRNLLLQGLTTGANRAAEIVHHLLSIAKGMHDDRQSAPVAELIRETERLLRFGFPKSISIHSNVPEMLWPVAMGATEFVQVLMNLCVNARDAMPQGGSLRISATNVTVQSSVGGLMIDAPPGDYVQVSVVDNGPGIDFALQSRIFDPFFTTKSDQGGTGLGLSTTRSILQTYDGYIKLYSEPGRGTRFVIYVPADSSKSPAQAVAAPILRSWPTGNGQWVLVIDDEVAILQLIKETLEAHNYQVATAADGAIGSVLYRDHADDIELVIIDLSAPLLGGAAVAATIRQCNPKARIILQSGLASELSQSLLDSRSVDCFIEKPYAMGELLNCVHELLTSSSAGTPN